MELKFTVAAHVARPVAEVFEAVVDPEKLSEYFTTGGARGRLETGSTVMWDFADFPGAFPVKVVEVVPNQRIVLQWEAADGAAPQANGEPPDGGSYDTTVAMTFEALEDGRTLVRISEEGWRQTPSGLNASYGNCAGWMQMLCALKVWIEHGINAREGMFK